MKSARIPEVMKVLEPLSTQWSPSRRAVVRRLATSEPPPGSVIASAEIFWPSMTAGSTRALSVSEPSAAMGGRPMPWLIRPAMIPPEAARHSSSVTTMRLN